jgi:hypothetical protein
MISCTRPGDEKRWSMFRPDPHPLDYDWRFDADTVRNMSLQIPLGRVLMMGCPSVAAALASAGREVSLVDIQPIDPCARIIYTRADIRFERLHNSPEQFDTVVIDSPWYIDYLKPWLIQARLCAGFGGLLMFSLWPSDTRPSASDEIKEILSLANSFGSVVIERGVFRYLTPKFEAVAAGAAGRRLGDRWRHGDLVIVRICKPLGQIANPVAQDRSTNKFWRRYTFDSLQVALRRDHEPLSGDLPHLCSWRYPCKHLRVLFLDIGI